jgi:hypothetical protein
VASIVFAWEMVKMYSSWSFDGICPEMGFLNKSVAVTNISILFPWPKIKVKVMQNSMDC